MVLNAFVCFNSEKLSGEAQTVQSDQEGSALEGEKQEQVINEGVASDDWTPEPVNGSSNLESKDEQNEPVRDVPLSERMMEDRMKEAGLVDVQTINKAIKVDLKYASEDNFLGKNMYGGLKKAYLRKDVALMLSKASNHLRELHPRYSIMVYDACRPVAVQKQLRDRATELGKSRYVASPGKSLHNYGAAVDVTILDELGVAIDMGSGFDFFGRESEPRHEKALVDEGVLKQEHIDNRDLLRRAMKHGGFRVMMTEWWHFNAGTREHILQKYDLIQ